MLGKKIKFTWNDERVTYLWPDYPLVMAGQKPLGLVIDQLDAGMSVDRIAAMLSRKLPATEDEIRSFGNTIVQALNSAKAAHSANTAGNQSDTANSLAMATLNITRRCNLRCVHCYAGDGGTSKSREMSIDQIRAAVIALSKQITRDPKLLVISGGEPTLYPEKLRTAVLSARECDLVPRVNTNGLNIDDALAMFLTANEVLVQVSIDGIDAQTHNILRGSGNSFDIAVTAVKRLVDKGCRVRISCTTHERNVEQIPDMIDFSQTLGAEQFLTSNLVKIGRATRNDLQTVPFEREFTVLYNAVKSNHEKQNITRSTLLAETVNAMRAGVRFTYCGTGCCTCCIDSEGSVYPCINLMTEDYCTGKIQEIGLETIWTSSPVLNRLRLLDVDSMSSRCSQCPFRYFCGGFCRGETLEATGKIDAPYARCKAWRKALILTLDFLSETPDLYDVGQYERTGALHRE